MRFQATRTITDVIEFDAESITEAHHLASDSLAEVRFYGVKNCDWVDGPTTTINVRPAPTPWVSS